MGELSNNASYIMRVGVSLDGVVKVVTGALSGLGLTMAIQFVAADNLALAFSTLRRKSSFKSVVTLMCVKSLNIHQPTHSRLPGQYPLDLCQ